MSSRDKTYTEIIALREHYVAIGDTYHMLDPYDEEGNIVGDLPWSQVDQIRCPNVTSGFIGGSDSFHMRVQDSELGTFTWMLYLRPSNYLTRSKQVPQDELDLDGIRIVAKLAPEGEAREAVSETLVRLIMGLVQDEIDLRSRADKNGDEAILLQGILDEELPSPEQEEV